jgi:lysophospholipase L1-like esterase
VRELLAIRDGLPRFAARLRAGTPSTIVAFGTSMTLFGQYLAALPAALTAVQPAAPVRLINRGLRGFFSFAAAFRAGSDVLPHDPDLVLIEFAHNESEPDAVATIPQALDGIIAQVRAVNPQCEFAIVLLVPLGAAASGPNAAMRAHEERAGYYGFPTFDLATLTERLVAGGSAPWTGEGGLTTDGIHHSERAAELIGGPFAEAFVELLRASDHTVPEPRPVRDYSLARLARTPVAAHATSESWATGIPPNHATRNCEAYDDVVAQPLEAGATFRIGFEGTLAYLWAMGSGAIATMADDSGVRNRVEINSGSEWSFHTISPVLASGEHTLEVVALELPLILGDLFIIGRLLGGTAVPDMVK